MAPTAISVGMRFRDCSHSLLFSPADLLASPIAPTLTTRQYFPIVAGQSRLPTTTQNTVGYLPRAVVMLTAQIREIGGKETFTPLDQQPCRLLPLTGSCAKPLPSVRLGFPSYVRSLQVAASPCCAVVLPDVISANLSSRARTPTPAASKVHSLVSSLRALAFPD
jgi:hypothetical protein